MQLLAGKPLIGIKRLAEAICDPSVIFLGIMVMYSLENHTDRDTVIIYLHFKVLAGSYGNGYF
jgi:hypothetical protein